MDKPPEKFTRRLMPKFSPDIEARITSNENITFPNDVEAYFNYVESVLNTQGIKLTENKNLKVLEVGSGNAIFLDFAREKGVNIVGVDVKPRGISPDAQALARIEQLPFRDESFDVILSRGIFDVYLYDYQNQTLMMKEIYRVLKHGGIYVAQEADDVPLIKGLNQVPGMVYRKVLKKE